MWRWLWSLKPRSGWRAHPHQSYSPLQKFCSASLDKYITFAPLNKYFNYRYRKKNYCGTFKFQFWAKQQKPEMLSQCKIFLRKFLCFWSQNPFHFCAILRIETQLRLKPESVTKDTEWRQRYSKVKMANFSFIRYVKQIVSFSSDLCLWKINFQNVTCGTEDKYRYPRLGKERT